MPRSFRLDPPEPRADLLYRPRLLRSLVGRWQHRVTSLTGGPGLGKTTLLAQAIAENRMAPRGEDVWVGVEEHDADAHRLARVVATAIAGRDESARSGGWRDEAAWQPAAVAEAVWHRAPTETCIVLDDVHLLPASSTGAAWLRDLVSALPTNGHVVFASRSEPPVPLTRIGMQGAVLRLGEADLRFSEDEMRGFASQRGVDLERLGDTGGWPAMAELAASVEHRLTGAYLWEEVLGPLGTLRRHILAVLCDLGSADDELISAAVGAPVVLADALDGVPLVASGADGWHVAHGLWRSAPGIALEPAERERIRRAAVENLNRRGRFDEAFSLLQEAQLWEAAPDVLRSACLAVDRLVPAHVGRWLATSPEQVRSSLAGRLATGLHLAHTAPEQAEEPLQEAVTWARAEGDVDAEMSGVAQLGLLAWWRQDPVMLADLAARVIELEPSGHPVARALACIARGLVADLVGDDQGVVAEMGKVDPGVLDTGWEIHAGWLCGVAHLDLGQTAASEAIVERLTRRGERALQHEVDFLRLRTWWRQGRVDDAIDAFEGVLAAEQSTGFVYGLHGSYLLGSVIFAHAGDAAVARAYLGDAVATAPPSEGGETAAAVLTATAAVNLAEGDESAAAAVLRTAMSLHDLDQGQDRRAWRQVLALTYVVVPETRSHWDAVPLRGFLHQARELARAVAAHREGRGDQQLRALDQVDPNVARAALPYRLAAELAVGLSGAGRSEGRMLLESLGAPGRSVVRGLAARPPGAAGDPRSARALLATVPAPPPRATLVGVLGPTVVRRNGDDPEEVVHPDLRRRRVLELLAFLVGHRKTTRAAITAALWPDLDDRAAANNLGVTFNRLSRILEPWRDGREPGYLLRLDGQSVQLVTGGHLRIDADEFDDHMAAGARAETDGAPSIALEHDLAAVALYRDDLHGDLPEAGWFTLDREHYRTRFVAAAVRAAQLLLSRGDADEAETVAHRGLAVDPWSEGAYTVLVGTALAHRDRSGALRMLDRCIDALADLGVDPSPATVQLQRRVVTQPFD